MWVGGGLLSSFGGYWSFDGGDLGGGGLHDDGLMEVDGRITSLMTTISYLIFAISSSKIFWGAPNTSAFPMRVRRVVRSIYRCLSTRW